MAKLRSRNYSREKIDILRGYTHLELIGRMRKEVGKLHMNLTYIKAHKKNIHFHFK